MARPAAARVLSFPASSDPVEPWYCSVKQAAEQIGANTMTVRRLIWSGELRARRIGRRVFVEVASLREWKECGG